MCPSRSLSTMSIQRKSKRKFLSTGRTMGSRIEEARNVKKRV
jgi:hypothetical protein